MTRNETTYEARLFASEYLRNAPTVSEYVGGIDGWVYVQAWSAQVTASWDAAAYLADKFGTEWKRTGSGAMAKLPV